MFIVVAPSESGTWRLQAVSAEGQPTDEPLTVTDARLPGAVAQRESAAAGAGQRPPVWTWWDTSVPAALLCAADVWVTRCRDLGLCATILATAATAPGSGQPDSATGEPRPLSYHPVIEPADPRHVPGPRQPVEDRQASLFTVAADRGAGVEELVAELAEQIRGVGTARNPARLRTLLGLESQGALVAAGMRHRGIPWDPEVHERILHETLGPRPAEGERPARMRELAGQIRRVLAAPTLNPDSQHDLLKALRAAGADVESTRAWVLTEWTRVAGTPEPQRETLVRPVLEYKKLSRIFSATGWHWLDTWVCNGRFHPEYVVGGVVTGRWAARGGGALQIPKFIRDAVRADPGRALVVADAAQLEPRVLAILARDDALAAASRDHDLYTSIAQQGQARGSELKERPHAKVALLGAMYGATTGAAGRFMPHLTRMFPRAVGYVEHAARAGERGAQVCTYLGRWSPAPEPEWFAVQRATDTAAGERRAAQAARAHGRFSRNFVVQGSAAEWALAWLGQIRHALHREGLDAHLVFFLHDEVMVHCAAADAPRVRELVAQAAEQAVRTVFGAVPVQVPVSTDVVTSYAQA